MTAKKSTATCDRVMIFSSVWTSMSTTTLNMEVQAERITHVIMLNKKSLSKGKLYKKIHSDVKLACDLCDKTFTQ